LKFIIVTGMSGAGKSEVLKFFEDFDYFCVDNLPPVLIPKFAEIVGITNSVEKVALGIDIRGGRLFSDLFHVLDELEELDFNYEILFLDASDEVLLTRFKESRRNHPLSKSDRLITGIENERKLLSEFKSRATYIIDTSHILTRHLREKISDIFVDDKKFNSMMITLMSFGFKYGIPSDSDLVLDVRFLPNPYYIPELKSKTGNDKEVRDFVTDSEVCTEFFEKLNDFILFLIPNYIKEGKNQLVISIGCTGGKHRSVTITNKLFNSLQEYGHSVIMLHRDIEKDAKRN